MIWPQKSRALHLRNLSLGVGDPLEACKHNPHDPGLTHSASSQRLLFAHHWLWLIPLRSQSGRTGWGVVRDTVLGPMGRCCPKSGRRIWGKGSQETLEIGDIWGMQPPVTNVPASSFISHYQPVRAWSGTCAHLIGHLLPFFLIFFIAVEYT